VKPRPQSGDGNLRLERLLVVVEGLDATLDSIEHVFAPASRSKPYAHRETNLAKSFRVGLGGIEIEYCCPLYKEGYLADILERFGPGVAAVQFAAHDIGKIVKKAAADPAVLVEENFDPLGDSSAPQACRLGCRAIIGFDVVLTPWPQNRFL
jgi:hypothetical protein